MGGELQSLDMAPSFYIEALKDPLSGHLDRIQVVKGWVAADGTAQERIYNVAWSDDRKLDTQGVLPPVGNTVSLTSGRYENSIGAPGLTTVWEDPDFDPEESAFYYVRVLEIPTPRWSTYDAFRFGIDIPEGKS